MIQDILTLAKPRLPDAEALMPYLREIDVNRYYSNRGPLSQRLEDRIGQLFGATGAEVVTTSSGTTALTLALMEHKLPAGSLCLVPSYTFSATAHAIVQAGLVPYFIDVDPQHWHITPDDVLAAVDQLGDAVTAVMPVVPFGAPFAYEAWAEFADTSGLAVVIDAAAAFSTAQITSVPVCVSLHASKHCGAGEGGFVLWNNRERIINIQKRSNFGFYGSRSAQVQATNGKMSEYHAAVGLASLDHWPVTLDDSFRIARRFAEGLRPLNRLSLQADWGRSWAGATLNVRIDGGYKDVQAKLARYGVEARPWWGIPCHLMPAFAKFPAAPGPDALSTTYSLADEVVGLPLHAHMDNGAVDKVVDAVALAVRC